MHYDPSGLSYEERLQLALDTLETLFRAASAFWLEAPNPKTDTERRQETTLILACQSARAVLLSEEREVPV